MTMTILSPMRQEAYDAFFKSTVTLNAQEHVAAGSWPAESAMERSRAEFESHFPQGLATPHCYFYEIRTAADAQTIGTLCFGVAERGGIRSAIVCHVEIYPQWRRQGHAFRAFQALEPIVTPLGVTNIGLHVFRHNAAAQGLYAKLGYKLFGLNMVKQLSHENYAREPARPTLSHALG